MDADAYLRKHGWRGAGASLGATGGGLAKPLLVSQKQNLLGLGATTAATQWDTWWSTSLDSSLQKLQVVSGPSVAAAPVKEDATLPRAPATRSGTKRLYGGFAKGASLEGTGVLAPHAESKPAGTRPTTQDLETTRGEDVAARQRKADKKAKRKRRREEEAERQHGEESAALEREDIERRARRKGDRENRKESKRRLVAAAG